jgi:hypothetical protein
LHEPFGHPCLLRSTYQRRMVVDPTSRFGSGE